jgi:hypothetical protein
VPAFDAVAPIKARATAASVNVRATRPAIFRSVS